MSHVLKVLIVPMEPIVPHSFVVTVIAQPLIAWMLFETEMKRTWIVEVTAPDAMMALHVSIMMTAQTEIVSMPHANRQPVVMAYGTGKKPIWTAVGLLVQVVRQRLGVLSLTIARVGSVTLVVVNKRPATTMFSTAMKSILIVEVHVHFVESVKPVSGLSSAPHSSVFRIRVKNPDATMVL